MCFYRRTPSSFVAACILLWLTTGCFSRNIETIESEEAKSIPPPPAPVTRGADEDGGDSITGTIALAPEYGGGVPQAAALYVILRVAGREGGPPLAVKSLEPQLPATFSISEADAMIPNTPLIGPLDVIARLDIDGNAFTREPANLEGRVEAVEVGARVEIHLSVAG